MNVQKRPPVIVVLGHVDHGKTTLLDTIRKTSIAAKEEGGITQSIGAYEISIKNTSYDISRMTFIDTPGHELFGKLRERGAQVADIALLLIDCVDGIKPQTIESIAHIKNAHIPYIVVMNKVDLPNNKIEVIKKQLLTYEVAVEGYGGDIPCVLVSAKIGTGINELLETILLVWSFKEQTYDIHEPVKGYIIESSLTKAGPVGTAIIKNGKLEVGKEVMIGNEKVKIRGLLDQKGNSINTIIPCTPCVIIGSKKLPDVGSMISDKVNQLGSDKIIQPENRKENKLHSLQLISDSREDENKKLKILLKTDTNGSLEAILPALKKNNRIHIVSSGIGSPSESDVYMAKITASIIIAFRIRVPKQTENLAEAEKVIIKSYSIIYELLDELSEVADLIYEKEHKQKILRGEAIVQALFVVEGNKISGIRQTKGKLVIGDQIELIRGNKIVGSGQVVSLRIRARNVKEVKKGEEAGICFNPVLDVRVGDMIKSYSI